jgi:hypothetical protein
MGSVVGILRYVLGGGQIVYIAKKAGHDKKKKKSLFGSLRKKELPGVFFGTSTSFHVNSANSLTRKISTELFFRSIPG